MPVLTVPAPVTLTQGFAKSIAGISLAEVGNTVGESFTVTVADSTGILSATGAGVAGAGTKSLTITGTLAQVNADLATLSDTNATLHADTLTVNATDGYANSAAAQTVAVTTVLGKPVLAGLPAAQAAGAALTPFASLQLTDFAPADGASVVLAETNEGSFSNLGAGTYSAATGVYSVSGTPAQVAAALQGLVFTPTGGAALAYTTALTLSVTNGAGTSGATTSITGGAALPSPVLSGVPATQAPATTVTPFAALVLTDPTLTDSASVVLSTTSQGTLGNLGIGTWSAATGIYRVTGTPAQVAAALEGLTFTPTAGAAAAYSTQLTLSVSNLIGTSGLVTSIAGSLPQPKPALSGVPATQAAAAVVTPFAGLHLVDPATTDGASVVLSTTSQGTLGNLGIGTYSAATGIYSVSGTPAQVAAALEGLTFIPTAGAAEAVTTALTLSVSNLVGTSSLSTSIVGSAPPAKPALSGAPATQVTSGAIAPLAGLRIVDASAKEGASVVLSVPAQGTLSNLGTGTYSAASGVYSVVGTPAQVAAAMAGLVFTPAAGNPVVTTTTVTLSDTSGIGTSGLTTSVVAVNQALLPIPSGESPAIALWSGSGAAPSPVGGAFNEAVVTNAAGAITAPSGFQAVLLGGTKAAQLTDASQGGVVLAANQGTDTLTAEQPGDTLIGGGGSDTFVVKGGDTVQAGGGATHITATGGGNTLTLGAGSATVTSAGGDTIYAGAGPATISAGSGDTVHAGAGALTFLGGTGSTSVTDANGTLLFTAASDVAVSGGSLNASGGSLGAVTVTGGGSRSVTLGSGVEQVQFIDGQAGGTDTIAGFNPASDILVLNGYAPGTISTVVATATVANGATLLTLPDNTHITLTGATGVSSAWFATSLH